MDSIKQSFYLISNASTDSYPENSLTSFKNRLPKTFETKKNEGVEISLSYLGISNIFRNILLPQNNAPSFIISNCYKSSGSLACQSGDQLCEVPIDFANEPKVDFTGAFTKEKSSSTITIEIPQSESSNCYWQEYFFEDKHYELDDLKEFAEKVAVTTNREVMMQLTNNSEIKFMSSKNHWLLIHRTMMDCFNFLNVDVDEDMLTPTFLNQKTNDPSVHIVKIADGGVRILRKYYYKSGEYFVYRLNAYKDSYIISAPSKVLEEKYPRIVRVECENISPQIFNGKYTKDLAIFSHNFDTDEVYNGIEFTSKQFAPISNTIIDLFSIKILDENNQPLQLLPGPATLLKMNIRERFVDKKSFNVRLSSSGTNEYPDNINSNFRVKLPTQIQVNRNWRVALTSISNPNYFSTFLPDKDTRGIIIKELPRDGKTMKVVFDDKLVYSEEDLVNLINENMKKPGMGSVELQENKKIKFKFEAREVLLFASNNVLKILGFHGAINENAKFSKIILLNYQPTKIAEEKFKTVLNADHLYVTGDNNTFTFNNPLNIFHLKPQYIMVYSNIVSKSIVGGTMSNILKVVPIRHTDVELYTISDFKHKEYYELQNSEIDSIEIHLRSHDGTLLNFATSQDTIINLEFSNYLEILK